MLKDLLTALVDLSVRANQPPYFHPAQEPENVYLIRNEEGKWDTVKAEPPPRAYQLSSLETVIALAKHWHGQKETKVEVWYSCTGVVVFMKENTRWDKATFVVTFHPLFTALQEIDSRNVVFKQGDLINLFKTRLRRAVISPAGFLDALKKVNFQVATSGESTVGHGAVSVGKKLESQIRGATDLPEFIMIDVPVFANAPTTFQRIELALLLDAQSQTFQLVTVAGDLEKAVRNGEMQIGADLEKELASEDIPVWYGTPFQG